MRRKHSKPEVASIPSPIDDRDYELESAAGDAARRTVKGMSSTKKARLRKMMDKHHRAMVEACK